MPNFKSMLGRPHLGAYDLEDLPGQQITATIKEVKGEEVVAEGGKKTPRPVLYFKEPIKSMVVNTTNGDTISALAKSERTENWPGLKIVIYRAIDRVKGGKMGPCLRIKDYLGSANDPEPIQCEECERIVSAYGNYSAAQVAESSRKKFNRNLCVPCAQAEGAKQSEQQAAQPTDQPKNQDSDVTTGE